MMLGLRALFVHFPREPAFMKTFLRVASIAVAMFSLSQSSHAAFLTYAASLSGPNESPANASPGTGTSTISYDSTAHTLRVQLPFSGLLGTTTASHIHAATAVPGTGTAGVATQTPTFSGLPLG